MTERDFRQVQQELDEVLSKLKTTNEPKLRRDLLTKMRRLLDEAERVVSPNP